MPWTKEQQEVIDTRDCDILVSAAAGSGKTAVLVERIIQKITDSKHPIDVDHLLVVTYTHAAANEMKERIQQAIAKKVEEHPGDSHLMRQMSLIHKSQITTIHSFCLELLRDYFYELDLDPAFQVGDSSQLEIMKNEVLDEILEEAYDRQEPEFVQFIESYITGKNDRRLGEYIIGLYESARSHVNPKEWLKKASEGFDIKEGMQIEELEWMKQVIYDIQTMIESCHLMMEEAIRIIRLPDGPYYYEGTFLQLQEQIETMLEAKTYGELSAAFLAFEKPKLKGRKKKTDVVDERHIEYVKNSRDKVQKMIESMKSSYFYAREEEITRQMRIVAPAMKGLVNLTLAFDQRYLERKKKENLLDFSDLEHFALELLVTFDEDGQRKPTEIAKEKAKYYHEIYIDEYQDSNFIQDAILSSVSKTVFGEHNMFMVGDVKQSIYSFRLARPELFIEKYNRYQTEDATSKLIELRNNFRSRKEVLNYTNDVFFEIMHASLGNIEYTPDVALVPSLPYEEGEGVGGQPELLLLSDAKEQDEDVDLLEATMIAQRIKEMVNGENPQMVTYFDQEGKQCFRKAEYRDIVILLRATKGHAEKIQQVLMDQGIPAFCNNQSGYFDTVEVRCLLSLLTVIDNVYVDIDMAAFLRSPMIGMDGNELAKLKIDGQQDSLYDCLLEVKSEDAKAQKAYEILTKLRSEKNHLSLHDLIWRAFELTDYYHYVGAMKEGEKRQANLLMLVEQAKQYEKNRYKGLFHFIRYMEQCKEYQMDFGEVNTLGENENLVSITSIHKSKGLEYPIVFLAKTQKKFNLMDANGSIILHPDYFIGPDMVDVKNRTKTPTILKSFIRRQLRKDALGEELRVLYVAMTRAKEKLVLTGVVKKDTNVSGTGETSKLSYMQLLQGSSYLDWILDANSVMKENRFQLKCYSYEDLCLDEIEENLTRGLEKEQLYEDLEQGIDLEQVEELKQRFSFVYPHLAETKGRLKYSVSEIKRISQMAQEVETKEKESYPVFQQTQIVPRFLKERKKVSPMTRGTAVHKIFELLDFSKTYKKDELEAQIDCWIEQNILEANVKPVLPVKDIEGFFHTDLSRRLRSVDSHKIQKEAQFVMGVPYEKIENHVDSDAYVVVQGIIDLYFEEEDGLVIVDYKTDHVRKGQEDKLIHHYKAQLDYYRLALEQMTGKKVKECYIYSVPLKKAILIPPIK